MASRPACKWLCRRSRAVPGLCQVGTEHASNACRQWCASGSPCTLPSCLDGCESLLFFMSRERLPVGDSWHAFCQSQRGNTASCNRLSGTTLQLRACLLDTVFLTCRRLSPINEFVRLHICLSVLQTDRVVCCVKHRHHRSGDDKSHVQPAAGQGQQAAVQPGPSSGGSAAQ